MANTAVTGLEAQSLSVQGKPQTAMMVFGGYTERGALLPAWGTHMREQSLRKLYRHPHNTLVQGAFAGLASKIVSTPFEISAPGLDAEDSQDLLRFADFGKGFEHFFSVTTLNYLRHDLGAWWELIGYGHPASRMVGNPVGIANLDPLRIYPTSDPVYPIYYAAPNGGWHKMHYTRIVQLVDMPDGDDLNPLIGFCALSRASAIAERQILMNRYVVSSLDDKPTPSVMLITNAGERESELAFERYREQRDTLDDEWGRVVRMYSVDPQRKLEVEFVNNSKPPESFDFKTYVELDVSELALALGVDKQELWELTGGGIGTGTQSAILAAKSRGKLFGKLLKAFERALNFHALPDVAEFAWKYRDPQEDQERANQALQYATLAQSLDGVLTPDEKRQLLANQIEAFADVLLDANGRVRAYDDDLLQGGQRIVETVEIAETVGTLGENIAETVDATTDDDNLADIAREWTQTRINFESAFVDHVTRAIGKTITRRQMTLRLRALLARAGEQAYRDGIAEAGGERERALAARERTRLMTWLADQSVFLRDFAAEVQEGITSGTALVRANAWSGNSLGLMRIAGINSEKPNARMVWTQNDLAEHCRSCRALNGQVHRASDWQKAGLYPKSSKLVCFVGCKCTLKITDAPIHGRLRAVPLVRVRKSLRHVH